MASISDLISCTAGVISLVVTGWQIWLLFRTPKTLWVTYLPTGRSALIDMSAGPEEGRKLVEIMQP